MAKWVEKRFNGSVKSYSENDILRTGEVSNWLNRLEAREDLLAIYPIPLVTDILILVKVEEKEEDYDYYTIENSAVNSVN